jgi:hypothetical protein
VPERRLILVLLLACAIRVTGGSPSSAPGTEPPEPTYQGRTLSQWFEVWGTDHPDEVTLGIAEAAIFELGSSTNGLYYLLKWLQYADAPQSLKTNATIRREHSWARWGFLYIGPRARPIIPELVRLMNNPTKPHTASLAGYFLATMGAKEAAPPLLPVLTNALRGPAPRVLTNGPPP